MKVKLQGELQLYPCPVVLVTSKFGNQENILTISWCGIACSIPEYVTIAVKPNRFSYNLIVESKEFGINIPNSTDIALADFCGSVSGRGVDKFIGLEKFYGTEISVPLLACCPVNLECRVVQKEALGGHHLFIAEVVQKWVNNELAIDQLSPPVYIRPYYYGLDKNEVLGYYGFSKDRKEGSYIHDIDG